MASSLGVPVKLLHESLGHVITVELKTGQLYRGKLAEGMYSYNLEVLQTDRYALISFNSGGLTKHIPKRYHSHRT